jgi:hypothetical protein
MPGCVLQDLLSHHVTRDSIFNCCAASTPLTIVIDIRVESKSDKIRANLLFKNEISARASTVDAVGVGELLTVVMRRQNSLR